MHYTVCGIRLNHGSNAGNIPEQIRQRPRAGHNDIAAPINHISDHSSTVYLIAKAAFHIQQDRAFADPIPHRHRRLWRLVAKYFFMSTTEYKPMAVQQIASTHLIPATIKRSAVIERLFKSQLVTDFSSFVKVTHQPCSQHNI